MEKITTSDIKVPLSPSSPTHLTDKGEQAAWSSLGDTLLTCDSSTVEVWRSTATGMLKFADYEITSRNRDNLTSSIAWFPDGRSFLAINCSSAKHTIHLWPTPRHPSFAREGSAVKRVDVSGNILEHHDFHYIKLHAVRVTPDSSRFVAVGNFLQSSTGLRPVKARTEQKILVYNMKTRQIERQYPVLNNFGNISVAEGSDERNLLVLISYKSQAPPQLWELELTSPTTSRLSLSQTTYLPPSTMDFGGWSCFGGNDHELVISFSKPGEILIWNRVSGDLLRQIPTGVPLECMAWNHLHHHPLFATGHDDGTVRIWVEQENGQEEPSHRSQQLRQENDAVQYDPPRSLSPSAWFDAV